MISFINNIDQAILVFIYDFFAVHHCATMDKAMIILTFIGDKGTIWFIFSLMLLLNRESRTAGLIAITAVVLAIILGDIILKNLIQRSRPFEAYPYLQLLVNKPNTFSFPSGHSAMSFAAAYTLGKSFKKYAYIFYILASLIAVSRMYLFMHYPTDIIGGIILGIVCSKAAVYIFCKINNKNTKALSEKNSP